jgi:hypothetical protein
MKTIHPAHGTPPRQSSELNILALKTTKMSCFGNYVAPENSILARGPFGLKIPALNYEL